MFKEFLKRIKNKSPKYIKDVWYNVTVWNKERKYPIIFDKNDNYINCKLGLKVVMKELENNEKVYYEVVKLYDRQGGDYYYSSDATYCDLRFSHIGK